MFFMFFFVFEFLLLYMCFCVCRIDLWKRILWSLKGYKVDFLLGHLYVVVCVLFSFCCVVVWLVLWLFFFIATCIDVCLLICSCVLVLVFFAFFYTYTWNYTKEAFFNFSHRQYSRCVSTVMFKYNNKHNSNCQVNS